MQKFKILLNILFKTLYFCNEQSIVHELFIEPYGSEFMMNVLSMHPA